MILLLLSAPWHRPSTSPLPAARAHDERLRALPLVYRRMQRLIINGHHTFREHFYQALRPAHEGFEKPPGNPRPQTRRGSGCLWAGPKTSQTRLSCIRRKSAMSLNLSVPHNDAQPGCPRDCATASDRFWELRFLGSMVIRSSRMRFPEGVCASRVHKKSTAECRAF